MKLVRLFICCSLGAITLFSCKHDVKNESLEVMEDAPVVTEVQEGVEANEQRKPISNSVLAKLMTTPETLTFTRYLISAGMTDVISQNEGPYTIIAPSNEAFEKLSKTISDSMSGKNNQRFLKTLLEGHVVEGDISSSVILQAVKDGDYAVSTMRGSTITFFMERSDLMVKDSTGAVAKLGKTDITSENGQVHLVDAVLGNF